MKTLNGQSGDMTEPQPSNVETYWVVDVFGHSDKVKVFTLDFHQSTMHFLIQLLQIENVFFFFFCIRRTLVVFKSVAAHTHVITIYSTVQFYNNAILLITMQGVLCIENVLLKWLFISYYYYIDWMDIFILLIIIDY